MAFIRSGGIRIALWGLGVLALAGAAGAVVFYLTFLQDLPDFQTLEDYRPPVISRVVDRGGAPIAEFYAERRRLVPMEEIPRHTQLAFVAAEDGGFFEHGGIDYVSILRAALANLRAGGEIKQGASTITQQMVKSLLLTPERTYRRKVREMILARRIEQRFTKEEILFLYLNQIYFGHGAWGIGDAARSYYGKEVADLTVSESALLAGLPQRPSVYSPFRNPDSAERRRRYVLLRMLEDGIIDQPTYEIELATPPVIQASPEAEDFEVASYFSELVRRFLFERFGGDRVLRGGLRVETTLDLSLQHAAVAALREGLEAHDRRQGYRGPLRSVERDDLEAEIAKIGIENELVEDADAEQGNAEGEGIVDVAPVADAAESVVEVASEAIEQVSELAGLEGDEREATFELPMGEIFTGVVVAVDRREQLARVALAPGIEGTVSVDDASWAREPDVKTRGRPVEDIRKIFRVGDVARFERLEDAPREGDEEAAELAEGEEVPAPLPRLALRQRPKVQGSLLSIDNETGDVLALVGGYDFDDSQFDRVTQARRQPGSAFKPFIYGAALSRGYTPVEQLVDRPIVYEDPVSGFKYKPRNYGRKFYGPIPMRRALAKSINNATVHLFRDVGVDYVLDYARRLGIQSPLSRDLSLALGSSSVTLLELTRAYAIYPRGGQRVVPRFITRVLDRNGEVLIEDVPLGQPPPPLLKPLDDPEPSDLEVAGEEGEPEDDGPRTVYPDGEILPTDRVISEAEAYLMCDLLKAVVTDGTGRGLLRLGGHLAGKTGTTNDQADAWFMGFSPSVTTGVWVGHDQVQALGFGETGAGAALPIWRDYMRVAMKKNGRGDFAVPEGIVYERIDPATGLLASASNDKAYFQPFVEGTQPEGSAVEHTSNTDALRAMRDDSF